MHTLLRVLLPCVKLDWSRALELLSHILLLGCFSMKVTEEMLHRLRLLALQLMVQLLGWFDGEEQPRS